jgi:hypothetical protein
MDLILGISAGFHSTTVREPRERVGLMDVARVRARPFILTLKDGQWLHDNLQLW